MHPIAKQAIIYQDVVRGKGWEKSPRALDSRLGQVEGLRGAAVVQSDLSLTGGDRQQCRAQEHNKSGEKDGQHQHGPTFMRPADGTADTMLIEV
jgi:hypothetical protein